jgi:hypothetical protein
MFQDFLREWEADDGFGVPTRVFNEPSLDDPRTVISVGFVPATAEETRAWLATGPASDQARHFEIDPDVKSTESRAMYDVSSEHDHR